MAELSPAAQPAPPAAGEVGELARLLRLDAELERDDGMPQAAARFDRAADLLEQRHPAPVPVAAGEVGDEARYLARELRDQADDMSPALELFGLMHRAADLLAQRHPKPVRLQRLESLAADAVSALRYIEQHHGRLYGVGWDRVFSEAAKLQPASIPTLPEDATVIEPSERTILVPIPEPVPVAERLPGPEDCDGEHYCWRWNTIGGLWARQPLARSWYEFESHWLPANALPLPAGEVE